MDAQTVEIHLTKHHQAYITNLNKAIEGDEEKLAVSIVEFQQIAGYLGPVTATTQEVTTTIACTGRTWRLLELPTLCLMAS
jgi:superoxide dismutase